MPRCVRIKIRLTEIRIYKYINRLKKCPRANKFALNRQITANHRLSARFRKVISAPIAWHFNPAAPISGQIDPIRKPCLMTIHLHQNDLPDGLNLGSIVAIDTETMGLDPRRDRLCVVQLSSGDGNAHLVQIAKGQTSAPNLERLLTDPAVTKLFHFGRFDVAALQNAFGVVTAPVWCTKIASRLVRTFTDRHGLKYLLQELVGVDVSKQQQTSDWGAAQLTEAQKDYAASDVLYLHKLKEALEARLIREDRLDLANRLFHFLPTRAELDLMGYDTPLDIYHH